ncbi:MAG: response regulator transcription factor [SAR202 cluster bacterium]|jgi:DNA-binding response OmpR family regulator|nr:response regulator transcription factor [SAR202 cluster bacterium]
MSPNPDDPEANAEQNELISLLSRQGVRAMFVTGAGEVEAQDEDVDSSARALALIDSAYLTSAELTKCVDDCADKGVPVIVMTPRRRVADLDENLRIADFIVSPVDPDELVVRAQHALRSDIPEQQDAEGVIRVGDLMIDPTSYEVTIAGTRIGLRFKEYELLRVLAESPGRVFNREALLSLVWGYDYFGGTRTVDVHIRRLRSKIEVSERTFIETIWNVGYRFSEI